MVEQVVQTFKQGFKKFKEGAVEQQLCINYRLTPHSTTGKSPAELMLGRQPRSRLDLLKPDLEKTVHKKQDVQKRAHDKAALNSNFQGEAVYVRNYSSGPT